MTFLIGKVRVVVIFNLFSPRFEIIADFIYEHFRVTPPLPVYSAKSVAVSILVIKMTAILTACFPVSVSEVELIVHFRWCG